MLRTAVTRARGREDDQPLDAGVALVMVVGAILVLSMLALTALAFAVKSKDFARFSQDYQGAIAAADAGVQDFLAHMNRDDNYDDALDCGNEAMQGPLSPTGPFPSGSCGYDASTDVGWKAVAGGTTDPTDAYFHYRITATSLAEQTITLQSTGRVGDVTRTVEAVLGKGGSTDYVYYTDYESADPANPYAYPSGASVACGRNGPAANLYWYTGRSSAGCSEITFGGGDVLDGPVFTNDAAWVATAYGGATFTDGFESANPGCAGVTSNPSTWDSCLRSGSHADFNGVQPEQAEPNVLDDTSAAFATYPGCHYYGSTRVIFSSNGKMTVWNKATANGGVAPVAISVAGLPTPDCGSVSELDQPGGFTTDVPNNMVVYVDTSTASAHRCDAGELGGPSASDKLPLGTYTAAANGSAYYGAPSYTYDTGMLYDTKNCNEGNLYVEGVLNGRVTLAAAQSIVVTGDVVLAGGWNGNDVLGLVATNSVEVFHPLVTTYKSYKRYANCEAYGWGSQYYQYCPVDTSLGASNEVSGWPHNFVDPTVGHLVPSFGVQIAGSIQTLQHSFYVQAYAEGSSYSTPPTLLVKGSIAQRWRGAVGKTDGHGYTKSYSYDGRLRTTSPPYFPRWVNSQWTTRYSGEIHTPSEIA